MQHPQRAPAAPGRSLSGGGAPFAGLEQLGHFLRRALGVFAYRGKEHARKAPNGVEPKRALLYPDPAVGGIGKGTVKLLRGAEIPNGLLSLLPGGRQRDGEGKFLHGGRRGNGRLGDRFDHRFLRGVGRLFARQRRQIRQFPGTAGEQRDKDTQQHKKK